MNIPNAVMIFVMIWLVAFFIMLQISPRTQDEDGDVVPGTPRSAPSELNLGRKVRVATLIAAVVMAGVVALASAGITPSSLVPDWMKPPSLR